MLLLYQCCKVISRFKILHLHSTMLLLYRRKGGQQLLNEFDLHSTMLLLYRIQDIRAIPEDPHLHSTMLLLYPCHFLRQEADIPDLHSTMLLLYQNSHQLSRTQTAIYIPLCFYFIKIAAANSISGYSFTFHYASTLSRLQLQIASADTHLHSTMLLLYHYPWKDSSYGEPEFTFHYASTLSSWMMLATAMTTKFTFHYASTLSGSLRRSLLSSLIYIPLCFYFISSAAHAAIFFFPIYIPLCFYFILTKSTKSSCNCLFTFHYASTLSLISTQNTSHNHNLHSTMLLLYHHITAIWHSVIVIYIPLCFYFIGWSRRWKPLNLLNLHSTMLLLYPDRHQTQKAGQRDIYIPLCFYFILPKSPWSSEAVSIYIPLCFYFIVTVVADNRESSGFTFHYASTLSGWRDKHCAVYPWFTFHYASTLSQKQSNSMKHRIIYIPLCFYFIGAKAYILNTGKLHLHSTMLLLYLERESKDRIQVRFTFHYASTLSEQMPRGVVVHLHLHSTMLLLYPRRLCIAYRNLYNLHSTMLLLYRFSVLSKSTAYISFTFHYASTLSKASGETLYKLSHLHSTMLLLYLNETPSPDTWPPIYIPLCFYFIKVSTPYDILLLTFTFHYASTLSLPHTVYTPADVTFTFHYASTLSSAPARVPQYIFPIYIPLCFYFILAAFRAYAFRYPIYIPLCFYFITISSTSFCLNL